MNYRSHNPDDASAIESLFTSVFTESESEVEGLLIGNLARELIAETDEWDLFGFVGVDGERILAAILFSRLTFPSDVSSFLLAPVAVHADYQGKGIGQGLINHGLNTLRNESVRYAITYGDPRFYSRVGFHHISPKIIAPPFPLSQPEGWLGQALMNDSTDSLAGRCLCVSAFDDPVYW